MPAAAVIHEEWALSTLTECIKYYGCYNNYYKNVLKTKYNRFFINNNY